MSRLLEALSEKGSEVNLVRPARVVLTHEVKCRIVVLLAQFQGLAAIRDMIAEEFGLTLHKQTIAHYDPQRSGRRLSPRLALLFEEARKLYVSDHHSIGISHQSHRLRVIERLAGKAEAAKQYTTAGALLKQAAEELGAITQRVRHEGSVVHMSLDDARSELAQRLASAIDGGVLDRVAEPPKSLTSQDNPTNLT